MPTGRSLRQRIVGPDDRENGQTVIAPLPSRDQSLFVLPALLGRHQGDLLEDLGGGFSTANVNFR
jgi:hypothetical protein